MFGRERNALVALVLVLSCVIVSPATVQAWNKPGHMVVAAIAYRELQRTGNQAVIDKVVAAVKQHQFYAQKFAPKVDALANQADKDLMVFMLAASWPDEMKGISGIPANVVDKSAHYVDLPFVPEGNPGIAGPAPDSHNLITKFKAQSDVITGTGTPAEKALALTWIFHLAGDSHQPLHAVSMFSNDFPPPKGDRGGNEQHVRVTDGSHTINLHSFWDGLLIGSMNFQPIRNRALGLIGRSDMKREAFPQLAQTEVKNWIDESFELAKTVVYKDVQSGEQNDGAVLPDNYASTAKSVAERQATLAGYRLADVLKTLAGSL
jgi:hypothetical protein